MTAQRRFPDPLLAALDRAKILGVRSGSEHRYTGVWLVVVRAVPARSERLREAVSRAYAAKYDTKASQKWVTGFAEPIRAQHTLELVPA